MCSIKTERKDRSVRGGDVGGRSKCSDLKQNGPGKAHEVTCNTDLKEAEEQVVCITKKEEGTARSKVLSWNFPGMTAIPRRDKTTEGSRRSDHGGPCACSWLLFGMR